MSIPFSPSPSKTLELPVAFTIPLCSLLSQPLPCPYHMSYPALQPSCHLQMLQSPAHRSAAHRSHRDSPPFHHTAASAPHSPAHHRASAQGHTMWVGRAWGRHFGLQAGHHHSQLIWEPVTLTLLPWSLRPQLPST